MDWGATSIRVCRIDLERRPLEVEVVHRAAHEPVADGCGSLRWDWDRLMAETRRGLDRAIDEAAGAGGPPIASIGIDTWGVDYGLLDQAGHLVSPPHAYRSPRTGGWRAVVDRIGERHLYERTGTQLQPFNTLFQLAVHDRDELARAAHVALLPDLVAHQLADGDGPMVVERTAAGTTALVDLATGEWSPDLLAAADVDPALLPPIVEPGTTAGTYRGVPIHRVAGHDTASAVAAVPCGGANASFVASGTWLLVGREQATPDTSELARRANLTNEPAADGGVRLLANVAGFWMVNECCRQWDVAVPDALAEAVAAPPDDGHLFDATDPALLAPDDMQATIRRLGGLPTGATRAAVLRSALEAMAATAGTVLDRLAQPHGGAAIEVIGVVGGGAAVAPFIDALRRRTNRRVVVGPVEAAAVGNALMQAVALGLVPDLAAARWTLTECSPTRRRGDPSTDPATNHRDVVWQAEDR